MNVAGSFRTKFDQIHDCEKEKEEIREREGGIKRNDGSTV